jgi:hypothetical protein
MPAGVQGDRTTLAVPVRPPPVAVMMADVFTPVVGAVKVNIPVPPVVTMLDGTEPAVVESTTGVPSTKKEPVGAESVRPTFEAQAMTVLGTLITNWPPVTVPLQGTTLLVVETPSWVETNDTLAPAGHTIWNWRLTLTDVTTELLKSNTIVALLPKLEPEHMDGEQERLPIVLTVPPAGRTAATVALLALVLNEVETLKMPLLS